MWTVKSAKQFGFLLALGSFAAFSGCGERPVRPEGEGRSGPSGSARDELRMPRLPGERVTSFDLDGDGRADAWTYSLPARNDAGEPFDRLIRREFDLDRDGRIDLSRTFDAKGQVEEERVDFDGDGRADQLNVYERGSLKAKRFDADEDGTFEGSRTF